MDPHDAAVKTPVEGSHDAAVTSAQRRDLGLRDTRGKEKGRRPRGFMPSFGISACMSIEEFGGLHVHVAMATFTLPSTSPCPPKWSSTCSSWPRWARTRRLHPSLEERKRTC